MKNKFTILLSVTLVLILNSCAAVYRCGESKPSKTPLTWGKNLKTVISERDILCNNLALKERENAILKTNINDLTKAQGELTVKHSELTNKNAELLEKYNNLIDENLSQADQYSKAINAKTAELAEKEKALLEREKSLEEMQRMVARQDSIAKRLNNAIHNALLGFNTDELSVEIKNGKVYVSLSDKLLFSSGSATIEAKGKEAIKLLAEVLNKSTDIDILIEGHTDNIPIKTALYKDNWDLSVARATSIVRILINDYNIVPTRVTASGKGEHFPRAGNDTADGRAKNRRTEIILSPKLDELMQLLSHK